MASSAVQYEGASGSSSWGDAQEREFNEAVIEEERRRGAEVAPAAAGLVPPQAPPRHLHSVS